MNNPEEHSGHRPRSAPDGNCPCLSTEVIAGDGGNGDEGNRNGPQITLCGWIKSWPRRERNNKSRNIFKYVAGIIFPAARARAFRRGYI